LAEDEVVIVAGLLAAAVLAAEFWLALGVAAEVVADWPEVSF